MEDKNNSLFARQTFKKAKEALDVAIETKKTIDNFLRNIGPALIKESVDPVLKQMAAEHKENISELKDAAKNIKVDVNPKIEIPDIKIPTVNVPRPEVTVNIPEIKIPKIEIPHIKAPEIIFPDRFMAALEYDYNRPMPVILMGADGKVFQFSSGGASGGKGDYFNLNYSNANPLPVVVTSGGGATTAANISDSSGVGYSGSNPFPVTIVTDQAASTIAVGDLASDVVDTGSAPVKIGGIARTANPTPVAAGDRVSATFDKIGRQVVNITQVRELLATAYVSLSNGTEATFLAGATGVFNDLIYIMGANTSDAAVQIDFRGVTAGNVMFTLQIPAQATAGVAPPVAIPQDATGNNWTADMPDITGTTVYLSGLFSKEV